MTKRWRLALTLTLIVGICSHGVTVAQQQSADVQPATRQIFRESTPPDLLADIAHFEGHRGMAADEARHRIIERGPAQVPAILAALDDVVSNAGTSAQAYHLAAAFAVLGDASKAGDFVAIARKMDPRWMEGLGTYDILDAIGAPGVADSLALEVISNPESEMAPLSGALSRYWYRAPANVAEQALQHIDNDLQQIRAGVYRVAVNGGFADSIRDRLSEDVTNASQGSGGVVTMMNVMAALEPEAEFVARIEGLNLNGSVRRAALLMNQFVWRDSAKKEAMLTKMLQSDVSELRSTAIAYILESGRGDLLDLHRLAHVREQDPFDIYREHIPGFDDLSREGRLEHIEEKTLALLEAQAEKIGTVSIPWHTALVAKRLGYSLVVGADGKSIEIRK